MSYTVKELAKISGVSVRTLHWYDEIDLLKPFAKGTNNYRYYEEQQLLRLQQILFFKELGFALHDIQKLLAQNDFENIKALKAHRKILEDEIIRKNNLIATIEKTIQHLKGKHLMKDEELYYGFDSNRHKEYQQYLIKYHYLAAEALLMESEKRTARWDKDEWDKVKNEGDAIHKDLAATIEQGLKPDSDQVQAIITRHYQMIQKFFEAPKEVYIGLTKLYTQHPDFKKFFDVYHPRMVEFISEAMRFYAKKHL
jgi:DNA-binding transcriptional MerR regulator